MNIKRRIRGILGLNTSIGNEVEKVFRGYLRHKRYIAMLTNKNARNLNTFYFVIDPLLPHPGLADRLKAIVSCYQICQQNGYNFKLIFDEPYSLSNYLEENMIKWKASMADLEYSKQDTRFYIYTKRFGGGSNKQLDPQKQYHCYTYSGRIIFDNENIRENFNRCFLQLFKPSKYLQNAIDATGLHTGEYVSVHVRFVNAIGEFENGSYPVLSKKEQERLIERCRNGIQKIVEGQDLPVVVFSDSARFLNEIKDLPVIILETSNIKHLNEVCTEDAVLKTFLDFMTMSRSKKVYRLLSKNLYKTEFSVYAAYAGGVEIESIMI